MRIIDNKGRLFGKLNIIDFIVIVVLIMMLYFWGMITIFGSKIFRKYDQPTGPSVVEKLAIEQARIDDFLRKNPRAKKYFYKSIKVCPACGQEMKERY